MICDAHLIKWQNGREECQGNFRGGGMLGLPLLWGMSGENVQGKYVDPCRITSLHV